MPTLQKDTRTRNVHASTAIEGNPLTLEEVKALEEGQEIPTPTPRSKQGTLNVLNPLLESGLIEKIGTKKSGKYLLTEPAGNA